MQLFCFTYAGGTAAFFDKVQNEINKSVKVEALEYAGHGNRYKESFYNDFNELSKDLYSDLKSRLDDAYALMGYSMGSISAVEILRLIISKREIAPPRHIFLAAHMPSLMVHLSKTNDMEIDEYVKKRTIQFGAIPQQLIDNDSFWRMYLPIYKADYALIEKYKFEGLDLKTDIPATVFYSETDTPYKDMLNWKRYFIGRIEFRCYEGNHFFILDKCKDICIEIENVLCRRL